MLSTHCSVGGPVYEWHHGESQVELASTHTPPRRPSTSQTQFPYLGHGDRMLILLVILRIRGHEQSCLAHSRYLINGSYYGHMVFTGWMRGGLKQERKAL